MRPKWFGHIKMSSIHVPLRRYKRIRIIREVGLDQKEVNEVMKLNLTHWLFMDDIVWDMSLWRPTIESLAMVMFVI